MRPADEAARRRAQASNYYWWLPNGTKENYIECPNASCKSHRMTDSRSTKSAVAYRSTATGKVIDEKVYAKCRWEKKCGYNERPPYEAVRAHNNGEGWTPAKPNWTPPPPPKQTKFWKLATGSVGASPLDNFGMAKFGRRWSKVVTDYAVVSDGNRNAFQYADHLKRVRMLKWTKFRVVDHLITKKAPNGKDAQVFVERPDKVQLDWCLFGGHLLTDGANVGIVEAEDTALFMSCIDSRRIWCASSGSSVTRFREFMLELPNCNYELFPDCDNLQSNNNWYEQAEYLRGHGIHAVVNEWWKVDEVATVLSSIQDNDRRNKADLKDWLLETMK